MRRFLSVCLMMTPLSGMLWSQQWEVGASAGYGLYRDVSVVNGSLSGKAGFQSGVALSGVFANESAGHLGGEIRYTYRSDDLRVKSGSVSATAGAQSHALHYDLLIHPKASETKPRPFLALGGGVKYYRGTGAEPVFQPLSNLVVLTHTSELQPLISAGGGIKIPMSRHSLIRLDFRDYMTPFPSSLLARRANTTGNGWMHDFVLMVGFSGTF